MPHAARRRRSGKHHVSNRLKSYAERKGLKKGSPGYNRYVYGGLTNVAKKHGTKPGHRKG